jgi:NADPH:quinone reductase-like Zn-dependent oxidoreductase
MKAIVCTKYGLDALRLEEIPRPTPGEDEVLVEVHASAVTTHNLALISGRPFFARPMMGGLLKPRVKIPGSEIAGRVEAIGKNVKQLKPGDEVYGQQGHGGFGAYSECACAPAIMLAPKPANVSFVEAAAIPQAALVALQGLRDKGQIQPGQKVLIYGASGGIGTFAVQIAKYFGAEVTGVCGTGNLEMVRSLGADHVIDYTKEDFTKNGRVHDLIFAIRGYRSIFDHRRALSPQGTYVSTGGPSMVRVFQDMAIGPRISKSGGQKFVGGWVVMPDQEDLVFMNELIEAGRVRPVIDRCYPLGEVGEAFRYYEQGHARGRVVITVRPAEKGR